MAAHDYMTEGKCADKQRDCLRMQTSARRYLITTWLVVAALVFVPTGWVLSNAWGSVSEGLKEQAAKNAAQDEKIASLTAQLANIEDNAKAAREGVDELLKRGKE